jgi:hypothetical protein
MRVWLVVGAAMFAGLLLSPGAAARDSAGRAAAEAKAGESGARREGRGTRVRLGGISVGAGYSHVSGYPYFGPPYGLWPYPWAAWDPLFYPSYGWLGGFVDPGYYRGYRQGRGMGQVKLVTEAKQGLVYLDGGYAGVAKDLKNIWLRPGAYNLEVRTHQQSFTQRIYVLSGKTLRIEANLTPIEEKQP